MKDQIIYGNRLIAVANHFLAVGKRLLTEGQCHVNGNVPFASNPKLDPVELGQLEDCIRAMHEAMEGFVNPEKWTVERSVAGVIKNIPETGPTATSAASLGYLEDGLKMIFRDIAKQTEGLLYYVGPLVESTSTPIGKVVGMRVILMREIERAATDNRKVQYLELQFVLKKNAETAYPELSTVAVKEFMKDYLDIHMDRRYYEAEFEKVHLDRRISPEIVEDNSVISTSVCMYAVNFIMGNISKKVLDYNVQKLPTFLNWIEGVLTEQFSNKEKFKDFDFRIHERTSASGRQAAVVMLYGKENDLIEMGQIAVMTKYYDDGPNTLLQINPENIHEYLLSKYPKADNEQGADRSVVFQQTCPPTMFSLEGEFEETTAKAFVVKYLEALNERLKAGCALVSAPDKSQLND